MNKEFIVFCFILALAACGEQAAAPNPPATAASSAAPDKAQTAYESAFIAGFRKGFVEDGVKSCMQSSGQGEKVRQQCECMMTALDKGLSDDEVIAMSKGSEPKDMEQRMNKVIAECK
ncbi:hypothetical protein [Kingella denitrificans]|uniref:hypothetical protein n=1 Tax=Kingella denitrificans TaxID=502 RepID=UPI000B9993A9|nr:hypothetical protein [Kingella denitrificans]